MNRKTYLVIGLLATLLTAGIVFGLTFVSSNHLTGTSKPKPEIVLTGNTTAPTFQGDTFVLIANFTRGDSGILITFFDNGFPIGTATTSGGIASIYYVENNAAWDIHAEANYQL
jgi:hypothetical protein